MIAIWALAAMVYVGGLLGVLMAVAEVELVALVGKEEKPRTWQLILAAMFFIAWPTAVTAALVSKALK
jgi:hypothetical protein